MSDTVHYRGTAKRVDLKGLTNEEFAQEYFKGKDIPTYYETALECLLDDGDEKFFFYPANQGLYEITREDVDPYDDMIRAAFDPSSDAINYELRYYNGGAGFTECLEEAFDKLKLH